jgi:hypothetical protein
MTIPGAGRLIRLENTGKSDQKGNPVYRFKQDGSLFFLGLLNHYQKIEMSWIPTRQKRSP